MILCILSDFHRLSWEAGEGLEEQLVVKSTNCENKQWHFELSKAGEGGVDAKSEVKSLLSEVRESQYFRL